jgi:hypothetical protein
MVLQDEAAVRLASEQRDQATIRKLRAAILEGQWDDAVTLAKTVRVHVCMVCVCVCVCVCGVGGCE